MEEKKQYYTLPDFLNDADFCSWARSERPDLDSYYHEFLETNPNQKSVFQKAYKIIQLFNDEKLKTDPVRKLHIWEEINRVYHEHDKISWYIRPVFRYAASVALLLVLSALTYYFIPGNTSNKFISSYNIHDYEETSLLLDDGKEISIQEDRSEIVYARGGDQIKVNNELVQKRDVTDKIELNQLIVPFGKQSKIILADRTEVWLNAGSRLVYPSSFDKSKREVQLQGEAYFKVSKDKSKPFIVETMQSRIKVLGTSFNVKAYPDEKLEETVLVEGSVSLKLGKSIFGKSILLKPDQRIVAQCDDNSYSISKVKVQDYTSWIEGLFVFNDEPLSSVLMSLSRFYDLDIQCSEVAKNKKISGKLDLKEDYHRVLNALTLISEGSYTKKDRTIYYKLKNIID